MALDESSAKALAEAVATGTGKVLRFPSWEKDAREVVQMKGLFADATDRAGQMRAALGKLGFEDVPQRAAQWHLCWLLSLWEEKVTRTWLKREGVLVEEESSDGEEDTDGEAADGEAAAEEPGVASLLTEMRKEVAALRAELAEAKNGQRPGSAGPGGLAVGLQALKPQAWTTLDGKERAVVYGELARRYAVAKGAQGHETEAHLKTLGIVLGAIGETETAFDADEALRKVAEAVLRRLEVVRIGQTAGWQEAEAAATAWEEDEAPDFLKKGLAAAEKMRRKKEKAKQGGNAFQKAKSSRGGEGRK
ncbi:hypothetical protein DIPPA_16120 [Diplonema papillatum]|nr:hypothetical protein DIPPA_04262 [Diplonema papillatum]KAJ9438543.1 hypothetical protein DIPPA_01006 [Diplonema papillatum]KAJ9446888.1 hypothetical protein DIPPA_11876 [Diplonema papillatum]KAJ9450197.1 hypothetical protein DIPPA_02790 [Diplonema papillatum]KAJ9460523.1 hypothetical protein DIPPA_25249 [Diplonema papillatum]